MRAIIKSSVHASFVSETSSIASLKNPIVASLSPVRDAIISATGISLRVSSDRKLSVKYSPYVETVLCQSILILSAISSMFSAVSL